MLLELAVGDAYGAGFEYAPPSLVQAKNTLNGYVQHPRHRLRPGCYTDDTQMSLAIAELLVAQEPFTPEAFASRFVNTFKRDPREGYASRFYQFLQKTQDGTKFLATIMSTSDASGAAMRAAPLGVLSSIEQVMAVATIQAAVTHNTPDGINAAQAAALMTHYFIYRLGVQQDLGKFLEQHVPGDWSQPWQGEVGSKGWMSVRAAITAVTRNYRLSDLLKDCIAFTGDVDTVATIALAAAACSREITPDLPSELIENLENGPYGRNYIMALDKQLMNLVSS